jgi:hypothetical protein
MPTVEQILLGLKDVANNWRPLAIFWHAYFAALMIVLMTGFRPSKRLAGLLLGLPLLSVSLVAWASSNPFNGIVYALIGILFIYFSTRLPREKVQIAAGRMMIPGVILFLFGWAYPHFLNTSSFLPYLYSAPTGLIPCATLSIVIGLFLILNNLGSRALSLILGLSGLFYGTTGVFQLKVSIDLILLLGAITAVIAAFVRKN